MSVFQRNGLGAIAALMTGLLFIASRDTGPVGPLVLVAPVPVLLYALSAPRAWTVGLSALVAGLIGTIGTALAYASVFPPVALAMLILGPSLWFMVVILMTRWSVRGRPAWMVIPAYALFATASEFLFMLVSPHGSAGAVGYALVDILPLLQVASLGGVAALSFLAAWVPAAVTALVLAPRDWRKVALLAGAPLLMTLAYGAVRLSDRPSETRRVALGAIDALQDDENLAEPWLRQVAQSYGDLARALAAEKPDYIVLPEKIFMTRADGSSPALDLLPKSPVTLVAGFNEALPDGARANAAWLFAPGGEPAHYVKRHLIPGLEGEFETGPSDLVIGDVGVAICKDMDFAPTIRGYGAAGVRLMLVPAWDFRTDQRLHARMAVVRGVENGFAMARPAVNGLLTVSDAYGRIVAERESSPSAPVSLIAELPLASGGTVYGRAGDVFAWLVTLGAAGILLISALGRIRDRKAE